MEIKNSRNLKSLFLCLILWMNELSGLKYNSPWQLFPPKDSFYHTPSEHVQFLPFSSLLEADTIFYRAINKTWLFFFSSLQSPRGTSLGCDVNVISFHMALQQANVTAESCSAFSPLSLPTFLSAACLSVLV